MGRVIDYDLLPAIFAESKRWPARQPGYVDCVHHVRDCIQVLTSDGLDILQDVELEWGKGTPWLELEDAEAMEVACVNYFANLPGVREVEPRNAPRGAWAFGVIAGQPSLGIVIGGGVLIARHDGGSRVLPQKMFTRAWRAD